MKNTIFCFWILASFSGYAQNLYNFLELPVEVRVQALGTYHISTANNANNPASFDSTINHRIGIQYAPYFKQANYVQASYFPKLSSKRQFGIIFQNLDFGKMTETDVLGNNIGDFRINNYAMGLVCSQKMNAVSFGIHIKLAGTNIAEYNNMALLTDLGVYFKHPNSDFSVAILAKNWGIIVKQLLPNAAQTLPSDVLLGASFKPKYMPMRFSLSLIQLNNWGINPDFKEHISGGVELLFHKKVQFQFGYNPVLRKAFADPNGYNRTAGFSGGLQFQAKRIGFQYSFSKWQTAYSLFGMTFRLS